MQETQGQGGRRPAARTSGHRHALPNLPGVSVVLLAPPQAIPGSERVRGDGGLPVQEGHTLQLDVHVVQALRRGSG